MPRKTRAQKNRTQKRSMATVNGEAPMRRWQRLLDEENARRKSQGFRSDNHNPRPLFFLRPSVTSFGSNRERPLWQSVLCDLACILTLGLYKP